MLFSIHKGVRHPGEESTLDTIHEVQNYLAEWWNWKKLIDYFRFTIYY